MHFSKVNLLKFNKVVESINVLFKDNFENKEKSFDRDFRNYYIVGDPNEQGLSGIHISSRFYDLDWEIQRYFLSMIN